MNMMTKAMPVNFLKQNNRLCLVNYINDINQTIVFASYFTKLVPVFQFLCEKHYADKMKWGYN